MACFFYAEVNIISKETKINEGIRAREVRLIKEDGEQIDCLPLRDAQSFANEAGLDLVLIAPNAQPPVCKIMDFGKFKFDQAKKEKEAKKKQKTILVKEMKLRLSIEKHDFEVKLGRVKEFLSQGNKVKITIMFRGREMGHPEMGRALCERVAQFLSEDAIVEKMPKAEGRNMTMMLSPKN